MFWKIVVVLFSVFVFSTAKSSIRRNQSAYSDEPQLIFAHVIHRHGDRNPIRSYPNDPWKDEEQFWEEGFGQLTNIGINQEYELGTYLRKRYASLLGDGGYSNDNVYIQSTDVDRTLNSAQAVAAGLFPPENDQIWNADLLWQPIPIHTIPKEMDHVLYAGRPCSRYQRAMRKHLQSLEYTTLMAKHKQLFDYLQENAGIQIHSLDDVDILYNTLWIEQLKEKSLPFWTDEVFLPGSDFEMLAYLNFRLATNTTEMARLTVGFLIRDILDRFSSKIESTLLPNRSLHIYSAHDSTIANFLNAIGLFELHNPPYASSLHIELYKLNADHYMQIFYRNSSDENLQPLEIPLCGQNCSLEMFRSIYSEIIPTETFEEECELPFYLEILEGSNICISNEWFVSIMCFVVMLPIMIIVLWRVSSSKRGNIALENDNNNMKYL
ncbi:prostatic acid phosphatase-like [Contarinia nasturtii]|uniref:prostatic acid phosphatase-like n=1 Tax=Contarinia nasturtii TaxID=265458 RepID=UPI0012D3B39B|nr:prostatic acid phosphatase-like [Contarinia nasturtii]XP_031634017.1 prostatic acid phosphatase-like [Contarinia nasturtii]